MKNLKYKVIIVVLFFAQLAQSQAPEIDWEATYGGNSNERVYDMQFTPADNGYILVGTTTSSQNGDVSEDINGGMDAWVVKTNSEGEIIWQNSIGGDGAERIFSVQLTNDGGYILGAETTSSESGDVSGVGGGSFDFWLVKLNSTGSIEWERSLGGPLQESAYTVIQTSDNGYMIAGVKQIGTSYDIYIVKYDSLGDFSWDQTYGGSGSDVAQEILETSDGNYVIAAYSTSQNGDVPPTDFFNDNYWLFKINQEGTLIWTKTYGGSNSEEAKMVIETNDGGLLFVGFSSSQDFDISNPKGSKDMWVVKTDSNGDLEWEKSIGGSDVDEAHDIRATADGNYIIAGFTFSDDGDISNSVYDRNNFWMVKIDPNGTILWEKTLGGDDFEEGKAIAVTSDNSYVIAGFTESNDGDVSSNNGDEDYWLVKLEPESLSTTDFNNNVVTILSNPVQDIVSVNFLKTADYTIKLFDVSGKLVLKQKTTKKLNVLDVSTLQNGTYVLKIVSKDASIIKTFKILKF